MITINNQRSKIQGYISLHVTEIKNLRLQLIACNRNERSALHALHACRTSFHASSHVVSCITRISCRILHHFMSYFIHFIVRITHITRISRMSCISYFANSARFMHCTIRRVILCVISYHFLMKFHITLIHTI